MSQQSVFDYIKTQENLYQTTTVNVAEGYEWSMYTHCKRTLLYLNSRFETGNFGDRPFNNIILDKVNLQHRAINVDVKDIQPFVNDPDEYYKSFLTRKYHDKWAREKNLGEFFNTMSETFTDYGGVIVKNTYEAKPEVVPFNRIAFVDQTDIANNPICEKHFYTPDQIMEYKDKWDDVELVIMLAAQEHQEKESQKTKQKIQTPTQYIEIYELHGVLPASWVDDNADEFEFTRQMHIVTFYTDKDGNKRGISLYKNKEAKSPYKVAIRDAIPGRGLGRGGVEELFEAQVWTNYNEILQKEMLDQASKILYQTADPKYTTENQTRNAKQGQIFTYEDGKPITQIASNPQNVQFFINNLERWESRAQSISVSYDSITGEQPKSGTPFRLGLMQNQEAHSLHLYRKEKMCLTIQEIYRDWILPFFAKDMSKGTTFLSELSLDEVEMVVQNVIRDQVNEYIKEKMFNLEIPDENKIADIEKATRENFAIGGGKKFIQIFKDEMKDLPMDVDIIITGENKNNAFVAEKLSAIFAQIAQNPAILQDPFMQKLFNEIIETSGLSPLDFSTINQKTLEKPQNESVASPPQTMQLPTNQPAEQAVA